MKFGTKLHDYPGFPPVTFERRGGTKGGGGLGAHHHEKKIRVFKFWFLKWPILSEMTVKYGKYFNFSCQQGGGDIPPPCGAEWGVRTPPGGNPVNVTNCLKCRP